VVAKITHTLSGSCQSRNLALVLISRRQNPLGVVGGLLSVRCKGEPLTSNSSGSSIYNNSHCEHFTGYHAKNVAPNPGEELEVELVFPKTRTAEFYFERPKLKGE
jgi:hypothetical protein